MAQDKDIQIDPMFFVPPGVIDVRQQNKDGGVSSYIEDDVAVESPVSVAMDSVIPMPPTSYQIVEQRVRIAPDGRAVIDVIVDFPDVPGVNSIDVAVTAG